MKEKDSYDLACTKRACFWEGIPSCESYELPDSLPVDDQVICENEGGTWLDEYQECEGVSEKFCDMQNGAYEECGSACRHDDPGGLCTLQCVQYCAFDAHTEAHLETQAELDAAMDLWSDQEIEDYTAEQKISCFCIVDYTRPISYMVV